MTTNIYKKRINNTFLKTLFVDTNYRNVKMGPLMSRQLTTKTTRDDITTLITSAYNKITIPYKYDNIKHLSYLLKILYSKINNLIISDLNDYEQVLFKIDEHPFNINVDFEKLYNALYYCLLTTNTNIYKIKKKSFGKKAYYFVYKIFKDDTELNIAARDFMKAAMTSFTKAIDVRKDKYIGSKLKTSGGMTSRK
jgi:hypothetical protein